MLMATQTGSAEDAAKEACEALEAEGLEVHWKDLAMISEIDFLKEASCILAVVSTWGDGEPPDDALPFFEALRDSDPIGLKDTPVSILGLGDSQYDIFCGCSKELEKELVRHGGRMLLPRIDCDTWYDDELKQWIDDLKSAFSLYKPAGTATP